MGPLQITWLLRNEPNLSAINAVTTPHLDELRRAGLFDVQIDKGEKVSRWDRWYVAWRLFWNGRGAAVGTVI